VYVIVTFAGRTCDARVGSDVPRDGMYLALFTEEMETVAEVFYSDETGQMSVTTIVPDLTVEAVEWLIAEAKVRLPPVQS
jgi:hypothetical protein